MIISIILTAWQGWGGWGRKQCTLVAFHIMAKNWGPGILHTWVQIQSHQVPTVRPWVSCVTSLSLSFCRQVIQVVPSYLQGYCRMMTEVLIRMEITPHLSYDSPLSSPLHEVPVEFSVKQVTQGQCLVPTCHSEEHSALVLSPLMTTHEASSLSSHFADEKLSDRRVTCFDQGDTASYAGWM